MATATAGGDILTEPFGAEHEPVNNGPEVTGRSTVSKGKGTFQPNNRRRSRKHGFRLRMRTRAGRAIVSARRRRGRSRLTA